MRAQDIEAWVLKIVDRVRASQPVEDFRVELKAAWPDNSYKAARRLAGHCNAARGEPVLWIIGLDEEKGVVGAAQSELADWLPQVRSHFESISPDLDRDMNVPVDDTTVVALLFNTDRAPFVVKNRAYGQTQGGPVQLEVPWREGTRVRTARREDLLRLLVPLQTLPDVTILEASLSCSRFYDGEPPKPVGLRWRLRVTLYVVSISDEALIVPFHTCEAHFSIQDHIHKQALDAIGLGPDHASTLPPTVAIRHATRERELPTSYTVEATDTEVLIARAGQVALKAAAETDFLKTLASTRDHLPPELSACSGSFAATLRPATTERAVSLTGELVPDSDTPNLITWKLRR